MPVKAPSRKKKSAPKRVKTGISACPLDRGFGMCRRFFYDEIDDKEISRICKEFVRKNYSKEDARAILANPEYHFSMFNGRAAAIFWMSKDLEFENPYESYPDRVKEIYVDLIESGKEILGESEKTTEDGTPIKKRLSPQELLERKVNSTIGYDLDDLEDNWINGETSDVDLYNLFQKHDLKGAAAPYVRERLETMRSEYQDAYDKSEECAVEAYGNLSRKEIKRRLDVCNRMIDDLDKIKAASKATRKTRKPKVRTADKQIKDVKYLKENNEYKLVSVDPLSVPGSLRLYTFNVKTRELTEYVTTSTNGFEIKGTTIQNFEPDKSRKTRLRKPDVFLPIVLKKTPNQIDKEWKKLTTKTTEPTGRINGDTILLRTENK